MSGSSTGTTSTSTGTTTSSTGTTSTALTYTTLTAVAPTAFTGVLGVNISPDTAAATTETRLSALGLTDVRTTVTTAAEESNLASLAATGIKLDLVLAPGQLASSLVTYANELNAVTLTATGSVSAAVTAVEGPNLVDDPSYTYAANDQYYGPNGSVNQNPTQSGATAGDAATYELYQAVSGDTVVGGVRLATTTVLPYSISSNPVGVDTNADAYNVNPGDLALTEPDQTQLNAALAVAKQVEGNAQTLTVVTEAGSGSGGTLLDVLLNAQHGSINATTVFIDSLAGTASAGLGTVSTATTAALPLYDPSTGSLSAVGTILHNFEAILTGASTTTSTTGTASTIAINVPSYSAGTQAADLTAAYTAASGATDIVWWSSNPTASTTGTNPAVMNFESNEGTVAVFDPTLGTAAIATFANVSTLDVTDFGTGPLVVQVSGTGTLASSTTAGTATYAGTASTGTVTVTSGTGTTTTTGGSGTGTTTTSGGSSTGTTTTTTTSGTVTASAGGTTTTESGAATTINDTATGFQTIISQGTDTINAGTGTDLVFASGSAATVNGSTGSLVFVAGSGSYSVNGAMGATTLYGGSGGGTYVGGSAPGAILVSGTGNTTLSGGQGSKAIMFGNSGNDSFVGSGGGGDTMVGGTGSNTFSLTKNSAVFGGTTKDSYTLGSNDTVVAGPGADTINFGAGNSFVFDGTGTDVYNVTAGVAGNSSVIGFKAADHLNLLNLTAGTTTASVLASATKGSFGTQLNLGGGTTITLFGVTNLTASQVN